MDMYEDAEENSFTFQHATNNIGIPVENETIDYTCRK